MFGLEEFFPPGVIEKGELAPESVNTGICLYFKISSVKLLLRPSLPALLEIKRLVICRTAAGVFSFKERRTLNAEYKTPDDFEV